MEWLIFLIGALLVVAGCMAMAGFGAPKAKPKAKYPPIESLGTLSRDHLKHFTQEDLDWWNQQRELMGLRSKQGRPRNPEDLITRVLAKASSQHNDLCRCKECIHHRRLKKLDDISRVEREAGGLPGHLDELRWKIIDDIRETHEVTELRTIDNAVVDVVITTRKETT